MTAEVIYSYDLNGNRNKTTYPNNTSVSSVYDARGRITSQTDQYGYTTTYTYDGADRLTSVKDELNNEYIYKYDEVGNLVSVTDANKNTTYYSYDELGRCVKTTNAAGKSAAVTYDNSGNILTSTDYAGNTTAYRYDALDRVEFVSTKDGTISYTYTTDGLIKTATNSTGTTKFTYDTMNGLTDKELPDGTIINYDYDKAGRVTAVKTPYGTTSYEYDTLDRLVRIVDRNKLATVYEYDANGNRTAVRYANGMVTSYTYDTLNRLIEEKTIDKDTNIVAKYVYTLGAAGERLSVTEPDRTVEYTYDRIYRLIGEKITENGTVTEIICTYDSVGNRLTKTENGVTTEYIYNSLNQLVKEGEIEYTYDQLGNMISQKMSDRATVYTYDDNGNLIKMVAPDKSALYVYDANNRLIKATVQDGSNVIVEEYTYDFAGNRTSKTTTTDSGFDFTKYLLDTNCGLTQVLAELNADGTEKAYYTRGTDLISQERDGKVNYYLYDGHGSVRMLADENGNVTDTYDYDAFGNLINSTGNTANNYRYCGEQFDGTTGLYYLRARYMNPNTGTFISMDSYSGSINDPVSLHKYLYANANPVMYSDPSGHFGQLDFEVSSAGTAELNNIQTINGAAVFENLVSNLRLAVSSIGVNEAIGLAMIPFVVYLGGQLSQMYAKSLLDSATEDVANNTKSLIIAKAINIMLSSLLQYVFNWVNAKEKTNNDYDNKYARHHIVPKGLNAALTSQIILSSVGINCYSYSLASPNIVLIKYSTHYALHSNNVLYCSTINTVICTAYFRAYRDGYVEQVFSVNAALLTLRVLIKGIDNLIL